MPLMGKIKNSLNLENTETVTLTQQEIAFLKSTAAYFQEMLDKMQQSMAVEYLKQIAVSRFEYSMNDELEFKLDMNKYSDNLEISKVEK